MPARDTPEAVILLVRLARANPMRKGEPIAGHLIDIAGTLNARLPAATRVKPDDLRLRKPIDDTLDLERYATCTIGEYVSGPSSPSMLERTAALLSILDYFVWCHALWKEFQAVPTRAKSSKLDEGASRVDDPDVQGAGIMLHWLASLATVINGWEELGFSDPEVEARMAAGGNVTADGSYRHGLERMRRSAFHFDRAAPGGGEFQNISDGLFLSWAVGLQLGLEHFFRHAKDPGGPVMHEWVVRGAEGLDPTMGGPTIMPRDPLAAAERFMAMLLEPTAEGAKKRRQDISVEQLAGGDPAPWVRAVLSLRDGGSLSADEAMHFVFDLVAYSHVGVRDAEVHELTAEMERIEQSNGIAEGDGGGELQPEWVAAERRYDARLQEVRVAYLRKLGAGEAAALLERSFETFEEAADRGNEEFWRRWPTASRAVSESQVEAATHAL